MGKSWGVGRLTEKMGSQERSTEEVGRSWGVGEEQGGGAITSGLAAWEECEPQGKGRQAQGSVVGHRCFCLAAERAE